MAFDVLPVFGFLAVDVAGKIQIAAVGFNIRMADHAGKARHVPLLQKHIHDFVDVAGAQTVLGAVLYEALTGVHHEDAPARGGLLLVQHHNAGGNARTVKQVGGQAYDTLNIAAL